MFGIYNSYMETIDALNTMKQCKNDKYIYGLIQQIISSFGSRIKTYLLEDYIESEWIDIYSAYYSKQRDSLSNKTIRVHFIFDTISDVKQINKKNYYGYITLRPICNDMLTVSRVRLRYDKRYYGADNLYVIGYEGKVSFPHCQIRYPSFPYFRQDGMVTVCAHADMHMLIKTMHAVHHFNSYGIANMLNRLDSAYGRDIPNEGLSIYEMISALKSRGFNPMLTMFENGEYLSDDTKHQYSLFEFVDSMIESQLPVILAFGGHVVLIAGGSRNRQGEFESYLVFDDSGYHLKKMAAKEKMDIYPSHSRLVKKETILSMITSKAKEEKEKCFVIVSTFKSLYYRYKYVLFHVKEIYELMTGGMDDIAYRITLVDSKKLKLFLDAVGVDRYDDVLLPRHVWYVEFYDIDGVIRIMLVDATAHQHEMKLPLVCDKDGESYVDVDNIDKISILKEIE